MLIVMDAAFWGDLIATETRMLRNKGMKATTPGGGEHRIGALQLIPSAEHHLVE